ncbi:MAG TPA: diguanylate cyclase [Geobacteraceae bacterium]
MSILIVDDSQVVLSFFETLLHETGYTDILRAQSASEAFALLGLNLAGLGLADDRDPAIDLILMDVLMPGMDGIEACRRLKCHERSRDIPIIIVTAVEELDNLQEAFDAGAMDYIAKPPNKIELIARVRSALRFKQEMDHRKAHERELLVLTHQLAEANRQLERLATQDTLTGIANRRFFNEFLYNEWRQALRNTQPFSIIMIDIDCFKAFNDTYGHQTGDNCLSMVASALQHVVKRPKDLLARYGGEEFVVVLPDTGSEGALLLAENMRATVERLGIRNEASTAGDTVTVSIGVATGLPGRDSTPEALIAAADKALYHAKGEGRNRTNAAENTEGCAPTRTAGSGQGRDGSDEPAVGPTTDFSCES